MSNTIEFEGQTEKEAVSKACDALKLEAAELDYTMLDEGSAGVFGLGARPVRIRVRTANGEAEAAPEAATPEAKTAEAEAERSGDSAKAPGLVGPAPEKAAMAQEVAQALAEKMGLISTIEVRDEDAQIVVVIQEQEGSTDVADTLGKSRPPAIPSFQFLLNKIVNRFPEDRKHIVVEVPSVPRKERRPPQERAPKEQKPVELDPDLDPALVAMGKFLADRAQTLNRVITVHPMLPADRRAVHQTVMSVEGAHTVSEGEGLYRRLHVVPDSMKAPGKRRRRRRRRRGGKEGSDASAPSDSAPTPEAEA